MRRDSGPTQGLLIPDSSTNTNLITTQVSHGGNRVSRPVRNRRGSEARDGAGAAGVMARIVERHPHGPGGSGTAPGPGSRQAAGRGGGGVEDAVAGRPLQPPGAGRRSGL